MIKSDSSEKTERTGPDDESRYPGQYRGLVRDNKDPERRGRVRVYVPEVMGDVDNPETWSDWAETKSPLSGFDAGLFMVPPMPEDRARDDEGSDSPYNETNVWVEYRDGDPTRPIYGSGGTFVGAGKLPNHAPRLSDVDLGGDESIAKPNGTATAQKYRLIVKTETVDDIELKTVTVEADDPVTEPVPSNEAEYPRNIIFKSPGGLIMELDDSDGANRFKVFHPSGSYIEMNNAGTVVYRTTGKEVRFISDGRMEHIEGPAELIIHGSSHHQVDKLSTELYRDTRNIYVAKSETRENRGGVTHNITGNYRMTAGTCTFQSNSKMDLMGADICNVGGQEVNVIGVDTTLQGSTTCDAICPKGVRLIGTENLTKNFIYAQQLIDPILIAAEKVSGAVGLVPSVVGGLAAPEYATFKLWQEAVDAFIKALTEAFTENHTIHLATLK